MIINTIQFFTILGTTACIASCHSVPAKQESNPTHENHLSPIQRISQVEFGPDASFALCAELACPAATRKSRFVQQENSHQPASDRVSQGDTAVTLDAGEVELTFEEGTPVPTVNSNRPHAHPVAVYFASHSATLSATAKVVLDLVISNIRKTDRLTITGCTDGTGISKTNAALAMSRIRSVRDFLVARVPGRDDAFKFGPVKACSTSLADGAANISRQTGHVEIDFQSTAQGSR